ncbi:MULTISPECIES: hypothetical protein [Trichocoleus]|uniref:Uncharacterized protein n=1 Tax=Trichocoleus desertorum GB2-A4 TaxID=2933944 RepID=A0ABV0JJ85_9CYAN|nr:hypothetical protein [Trichocoleus sp. FACHB-46]MBD1862368.1 hypothetical protein [Trichocoleus sp. FACHB-46]
MNRIKVARWLIISAVIVVGIVEYNIREQNVKADYRRLASTSKAEEKQVLSQKEGDDKVGKHAPLFLSSPCLLPLSSNGDTFCLKSSC